MSAAISFPCKFIATLFLAALTMGCGHTAKTITADNGFGLEVLIPRFNAEPYRALVALPSRAPSERMITVKVFGEVKAPGVYSMPEGTTVFEAIQRAGGPQILAWLRKVHLSDETAKRVLILETRQRPGRLPWVWFRGAEQSSEDLILRDGALIEVPIIL